MKFTDGRKVTANGSEKETGERKWTAHWPRERDRLGLLVRCGLSVHNEKEKGR